MGYGDYYSTACEMDPGYYHLIGIVVTHARTGNDQNSSFRILYDSLISS